MIAAAASRTDRILEMVRLALQLRAAQSGNHHQLDSYLDATVKKALAVLEHPSEELAGATPEAVSLAVALASNDVLARSFRELINVGDPKVRARDALHGLEAVIDSNSQSAYFGREVYSAI